MDAHEQELAQALTWIIAHIRERVSITFLETRKEIEIEIAEFSRKKGRQLTEAVTYVFWIKVTQFKELRTGTNIIRLKQVMQEILALLLLANRMYGLSDQDLVLQTVKIMLPPKAA